MNNTILAPLSATSALSLTTLIPTAMGLITSTAFWGTVAHSMGMLPWEAFIHAEQLGVTLPEMPR